MADLSDTSNSTQEARSKEKVFDFSTSDFAKLVKTTTFVDKTLMIKDIFISSSHILITAPRWFGKSTNINMIKRFLEIEVDATGAPKPVHTTKNYKLFKANNLNICNDEEFFNKHFGKHPVIYIDLEPLGKVCDSVNMLDTFSHITRKSFNEHSYLLDRARFRIKTIYFDEHLIENIGEPDLLYSFEYLSTILQRYFRKKVFVLIDNYDAFVHSVLFKNNNQDTNRMMLFIGTTIDNLLKNRQCVGRALLTGVLPVISDEFCLLGNSIDCHSFLDSHPFCKYYGLTSDELNKILSKLIKGDQESNMIKIIIDEYYSGYYYYVTENQSIQLYNIWLVLQYLRRQKVQKYWYNHVCFKSFIHVFNNLQIQDKIKQLLSGNKIQLDITEPVSTSDLLQLNNIIASDQLQNMSSSLVDTFFVLLYHFGYLSISKVLDWGYTYVKIPNKEIIHELLKVISGDQKLDCVSVISVTDFDQTRHNIPAAESIQLEQNISVTDSVHIERNNPVTDTVQLEQKIFATDSVQAEQIIFAVESLKIEDIPVTDCVQLEQNISATDSVQLEQNISATDSVQAEQNIFAVASHKVEKNISVTDSFKVEQNISTPESVLLDNVLEELIKHNKKETQIIRMIENYNSDEVKNQNVHQVNLSHIRSVLKYLHNRKMQNNYSYIENLKPFFSSSQIQHKMEELLLDIELELDTSQSLSVEDFLQLNDTITSSKFECASPSAVDIFFVLLHHFGYLSIREEASDAKFVYMKITNKKIKYKLAKFFLKTNQTIYSKCVEHADYIISAIDLIRPENVDERETFETLCTVIIDWWRNHKAEHNLLACLFMTLILRPDYNGKAIMHSLIPCGPVVMLLKNKHRVAICITAEQDMSTYCSILSARTVHKNITNQKFKEQILGSFSDVYGTVVIVASYGYCGLCHTVGMAYSYKFNRNGGRLRKYKLVTCCDRSCTHADRRSYCHGYKSV